MTQPHLVEGLPAYSYSRLAKYMQMQELRGLVAGLPFEMQAWYDPDNPQRIHIGVHENAAPLVTYRAGAVVVFTVQAPTFGDAPVTVCQRVNAVTPEWFQLVHHTGSYHAVLAVGGYIREEAIEYKGEPKVWRANMVRQKVQAKGLPLKDADALPHRQLNVGIDELRAMSDIELGRRTSEAWENKEKADRIANERDKVFEAFLAEGRRRKAASSAELKAVADILPDPFPHPIDTNDPEPTPTEDDDDLPPPTIGVYDSRYQEGDDF